MRPVRIAMLLEKFAKGLAGIEELIRKSAFKEASKSSYLDMVRDRIKRLRITHQTK
jgi:hypothetical protein